MIQKPAKIFFSRWEEQNEENKWIYMSAYTLASAAKKFFFSHFEDKDWWAKWNVIELHGYDNPKVCFVEYDQFGVHPFPKEVRRIVFYPREKKIAELKILDPYILHDSHLLIPEKGMGAQDPFKNPQDRKVWFRKCEELSHELRKHGLTDHPQAYFHSGWKEMLTIKGLEIINLPDAQNPKRMTGWSVEVTEINTDYSFGDL